MHKGELRKNTIIHTEGNFLFRAPKGTRVIARRNEVNVGEEYILRKIDGDYYLEAFNSLLKIKFPGEKRLFYPLSLLG